MGNLSTFFTRNNDDNNSNLRYKKKDLIKNDNNKIKSSASLITIFSKDNIPYLEDPNKS